MKYERLTKRYPNGVACFKKCITCPTPGCSICKFNDEKYSIMFERLAELEDMIENKKIVFVPEYSEKYAIIKYTFWKNQPFDIAIYYPCGVKMNGDIDYRYSGIKSRYITVIEDGFDTKEAAKEKLKELKGE